HLGEETFAPVFSYPVASLLFANTLSPKLKVVYNAGFAYSGKNADGFFIYRIALNYAPAPKFVVFIEPFGNFDHGDLPNHKLQGGLTFAAGNNLQFDAFYGVGLSDEVDKSFGGVGISWRIPR
ncbi:MAG: transporter, partial [Bacteroidales bacterium]|nr:transporter [Bacteroidales bacterium]